jgi:hypothetical protein
MNSESKLVRFLRDYIWIFIVIILISAFVLGKYNSKKEANTFSCKFDEITVETVKNLPGGDKFDANIVNKFNMETPYCVDLCKEELKNSQKYPNEWWITDDSREICKKVGIILPR